MDGQAQGGGEVVAEVLKTRCGCHPETCCCGDYTLWLNGKAVAKGFRDKMQAIADAINAKPAPPSAPVGVEVKVLARDVHYAIRDAGLAPESPADDAAMRDAILRTLAQQPAADGGFTAADMMDARQEGRKEAQQPAAVDGAK